jgi:integrase/recombinase XerD
MSKRCSQRRPSVADGLHVHRTEFLAALAKAGYAEKTRRDKRRVIVPFIRWVHDAGIRTADLDEACVGRFLGSRSRRCCKDRALAHTALRQFLEHLRTFGVVPPLPSDSSPPEVLVRRYLDHLRGDRGLSPRSVAVYSPLVRAFIVAQRLPERTASLDASAVRSYLLHTRWSRSFSCVRLLAAALRSFLRFLFFDGATATDLSRAVPPLRRWRLAAAPRFLMPEEVERVIAAIDRSTARGLRTLAMMLLLARLGLRAGEVVALELDDIRWNAGEVVVHGKGRLHDRLPLLDDVGEALALYLREARGASVSRRVFLRHYAPRVGLSGPHAVSVVARDALRRAGLLPTGRVGAHVFRYSLATQMIRRGASFAEISQVLRHRCIHTTQLYAKVEFEALRGVALAWPGEGVLR